MNLFSYKILGLYFFSCGPPAVRKDETYNKTIEEGFKNLEKDEKYEKKIKNEVHSSKENITKEDFKNLIKYLKKYLKNYKDKDDNESSKTINSQFLKNTSEFKIDKIGFFEFIKKNNLKSLTPYIKYENPKGDGIPRVYELAEDREIESQVDKKFGKKDEVYKLEFKSENEDFNEEKYPNYLNDSEFKYDVFGENIEINKKNNEFMKKYVPFSLNIYFDKNGKLVLVKKQHKFCYKKENDNNSYNTTISTDNLLKVE
jgi:hypothetical protein